MTKTHADGSDGRIRGPGRAAASAVSSRGPEPRRRSGSRVPFALALACAVPGSLPADAPFATGAGGPVFSVSPEDCRRHVAWLADDAREGREAGEPGAAAAADYIAERFREAGLGPPPGDGRSGLRDSGFRQVFDLQYRRLGPNSRLDVLGPREALASFRLETMDFSVFDFSGRGEATVPVVFAGYGIAAPERGYDDYAGVDLRGKAVLVLRHEPRERPGGGTAFDDRHYSSHAYFTAKASRARERGAVALLLVTDPLHHPVGIPYSAATLFPEPLPDFLRKGLGALADGSFAEMPGRTPDEVVAHAAARGRAIGGESGIPAVHVAPRVAEAILRPAGASLADLQRSIDRSLSPATFDVPGVRVALRVDMVATPRPTANVVAALPGRDPARKDEWVVVGAHYDHVGRGAPGGDRMGSRGADDVYNGADDNASGTAALLEAARALAALPERPRRTILFAAFGAEEKGLLGSAHFVEALGEACSRVAVMVNCDMVGRNEPRGLLADGVCSSSDVEACVRAGQREAGLDVTFVHEVSAGSDHYSFYRRKIPVVFFFSGFHADYHTPDDEAEKIDADKVARVARLTAATAWRLAELETRPAWREIPPDPAPVAKGLRRAGLEVERMRGAASELDVLSVTGVGRMSPPAAAGVRAGDVVLAAGDEVPPAAGPREWLGRKLEGVPAGGRIALRVWRGHAVSDRTLRMSP